MVHFAPAASISFSKASRCSFGATGSGAPCVDEKRGLHRTFLRRALRNEIAVDRYGGSDVGAVARQFEHVAAAEAESDCGTAAVDQIALRAFRDHCVVGGADALSLLDGIVAQRIGERRAFAEIGRPRADAIHIGDKNDIAVAGDKLGRAR